MTHSGFQTPLVTPRTEVNAYPGPDLAEERRGCWADTCWQGIAYSFIYQDDGQEWNNSKKHTQECQNALRGIH